jgi:diaminohydroxyphosphoribosylaminopyrimidine deaminase/5-amino-6-(5-phosphoribosylamino)uracil reductase
MIDPSEHAGGKGIEQLRRAGIEVEVGLCETEARLSNGPFVKFTTTGRCWVTLKWAQSIDGKVAWAEQSTEQRWISNEQSRKDVHKLRRRAQAILVGVNTVIADDPLLTARPSKGRKAIRVVADNSLRTPSDCQLARTADKSPVMIVTKQEIVASKPQVMEELTGKGVEVLARSDTDSRSSLHFVLDELSSRGITHLLVEGGPTILTSFLRENLADEIVVYIAPKILGGRGGAGIAEPMAELPAALDLQNVEIAQFGNDVRLSGWTARAVREISESTYE